MALTTSTSPSVATEAKYQWDYIESYRLSQDDIDGYLKKKFGDWEFFIQVRSRASPDH
jgi:hypothetical protein